MSLLDITFTTPIILIRDHYKVTRNYVYSGFSIKNEELAEQIRDVAIRFMQQPVEKFSQAKPFAWLKREYRRLLPDYNITFDTATDSGLRCMRTKWVLVVTIQIPRYDSSTQKFDKKKILLASIEFEIKPEAYEYIS